MPRQDEYPLNTAPDALDNVLLCENPDPAGDGSVTERGTKKANLASLSGKSTQITTNYTLQYNNEIVLADTAAGDITVTIPGGWPDDSKFTVVKTGSNAFIVLVESATETFQPPRVRGNALVSLFGLLIQGEAVSYVKKGDEWYLYSNSIDSYKEIYFVPIDSGIPPGDPGGPIDLTGISQVIPFELNTAIFSRTLLFSSLPVGGVFTSAHNILMTCDVQVQFLHNIGSNNSDVWANTNWTTSADPENAATILVDVNAAFAHTRTGEFGDTKQSSSLIQLNVSETFQLNGYIVSSSGGSTSDIYGILVTFST